MLEPRLVMVAPAACPSAAHVSLSAALAHRPWSDTLAITVSRSGRPDTSEMLPHSDAIPVRLAADGTHDEAIAAVVLEPASVGPVVDTGLFVVVGAWLVV